jgi:hypothetical protein
MMIAGLLTLILPRPFGLSFDESPALFFAWVLLTIVAPFLASLGDIMMIKETRRVGRPSAESEEGAEATANA